MEKLLKKQYEPSLVGLVQAFGVAVYSGLVAGFFSLAEKIFYRPGFLGIALMLVIFVFSAAITGSLVFGYPALLALNKKVKEAIYVLAYTFLYFVIIILLVILVMVSFSIGT